jgi:lysine 6-dehydrogenase
MAADLEGDFEVTAVDASEAALERLGAKCPGITRVKKDLSDPAAVTEVIAGSDLVLNAVPGFMGYRTLETILRAGKRVVDIAFCPEDIFGLDELAREKGVCALVDFGVAPGMSNLLAGKIDHELDETETVLIYVGGLPERRTWPFEYKAGFSPSDVIEEYTRPARYVENGELVVRPALSDPEILEFPGIGSLEAFNTDGLRTLITTIDAPNKKEKTMRYVGHIEKMAVLRAMGLFDQEEIEIGGARIRPLDFTSRLLFPMWKLEEGEVDLTVMRVVVEGRKGDRRRRTTFDLFDRYDEATGVHSMARTTGYTATMGIRMLAAGLYDQKGIIVPEYVGRHADCVEFLLAGLRERGIVYEESIEELGAGE